MDSLGVKDLRIGNLIEWSGHLNVVEAIFTHADNAPTVMCNPLEAERELSEFSPIPLTEDWLIRLGFEKVNHIHGYTFWHHKEYRLSIYDTKTEWMSAYVKHHCKYIHQVQNLIFALTGKELEVKEPARK